MLMFIYMPEINIPKIEKQDIVAPVIEPEGTAIVLQRHERYDRHRDAEDAGSILPEAAVDAYQRDVAFFQDVLGQETDGVETLILFASSDTQYAGKGYRSLETAEVAQNAAIDTLKARGIDPVGRIINLNSLFATTPHKPTNQDIRPIKHLREPQIFDTPEYVDHLRQKYGEEDGPGIGISQSAWAAHESDVEKEVRESFGAEGVHDILDRTKRSISILERYSSLFHASNPNKRLIIWVASHYDTISPLVKDATGASFEDYVPVDYGAGVIMNIAPHSHQVELVAQSQRVALKLGREALDTTEL
jgi:hypothetical protein